MVAGSYSSFCHQIDSVIKEFPHLKITELDGVRLLKGILDIVNDNDEIVGRFSIEIKYCVDFPYRFPLLYEVGGDIPNLADWHKYTDEMCCITVEPDEILKCKDGISVITFIENYAIPYFANQIYRKQNGVYKNGEYSHGIIGLLEFYSVLFQTPDKSKWREYVNLVSSGKAIKAGRNDRCFCGSGLKYKNCHDKIFYDINRLGIKQIIKDLKMYIL